MPVTLDHRADSRKLTLSLSEKLKTADYEVIVPRVEELIKKHGTIDLLLELSDFHGWTAGALWQDLKFDFEHFNEIRRLAIVSEKQWPKGMAAFWKPFTTAQVRFFPFEQRAEADRWVEEASPSLTFP